MNQRIHPTNPAVWAWSDKETNEPPLTLGSSPDDPAIRTLDRGEELCHTVLVPVVKRIDNVSPQILATAGNFKMDLCLTCFSLGIIKPRDEGFSIPSLSPRFGNIGTNGSG